MGWQSYSGHERDCSRLAVGAGSTLFNAQCDILEGRPSLGTARAVWTAVMLLFITLGVWLARELLEGTR